MARANLVDEHGNSTSEPIWNPPPSPVQPAPPPAPAPTFSNPGGPGPSSSSDIARINQQYGGQGVEAEDAAKLERLRQQGTQANGESYESYLREIEEKQKRRTAPTSDRRFDSQSSAYNQATNQLTSSAQQAISRAQGAGRTTFDYPGIADQFSDPYTMGLENLLKQQLEGLQQPQTNPALERLLAFLDTRFSDLSNNPGYTPSEQALLRTQALDPIEQDRAASLRRSQQRTAARGMLPSSGLAELQDQQVDLEYDRLRGAAQRDLGINAINKQNQDLAQALTLGQLAGVAIPEQQRAEDASRRNEAVSRAMALYNLPRKAQADAMSVLNGTPMPGDLFSQAIQLMQAQESQRRYTQQQNQQFWLSIGDALAEMFG